MPTIGRLDRPIPSGRGSLSFRIMPLLVRSQCLKQIRKIIVHCSDIPLQLISSNVGETLAVGVGCVRELLKRFRAGGSLDYLALIVHQVKPIL